jgi:hypothetical protein
MSLRIDSTEWISGALLIGETGLGVLGSAIASTGDSGAGYAYNDLSLPADNAKEICGRITSWPMSGSLVAYEDTSFIFTGGDGSYSFTYQLYVDGVATGLPVTVSLFIGASLPTIGRPLSTTTPGAWTATGGTGGLPGAINETTHSAAEYISAASASMCEMTLDTTAYPGGATQVLSYWASSTAGSTLTVRLRQSGATVASWTHPLTTSDTLYQQTLTAPQIAALTSGAVSVQLETS